MEELKLREAATLIFRSHHTTVFTGAGISVESGIPPFRGEGGIWTKYDPMVLELSYFLRHPEQSWQAIKEMFYEYYGKVKPNRAHEVVALLEKEGFVKAVITQNIDNLHQEAGSRTVYEFHGNYQRLVCLDCNRKLEFTPGIFDNLPPRCPHCGGLLKPDFVFFGEMIPPEVSRLSFAEAEVADVFLLIGTTGEVYPAASIPAVAKNHGAKIIEVNVRPSNHTRSITDIFLQGKATAVLDALWDQIRLLKATS